LTWVAERHPAVYVRVFLFKLLQLEDDDDTPLQQPHLNQEGRQRIFCEYPGATRKTPTHVAPPEPHEPWHWTGLGYLVGALMHRAVVDPKGFCRPFAAAFLRPPSKAQRGLAKRRAWERAQAAGS
jgi:hypothetical protein